MWLWPRRRTHYALRLALGMERRLGVGERRNSPRVSFLGNCYVGDRREERNVTQSGQWLRRKPPGNGNCAATVSVRSAVAARPEQGEAAVPLPVSSSYAAVVGKRPELVVRSNRRVQRVRSRFSRSARVTEE